MALMPSCAGRAELWRLRLHPQGGLALLPSPVDGKRALVMMNGSGAASRGTRWYAGPGIIGAVAGPEAGHSEGRGLARINVLN